MPIGIARGRGKVFDTWCIFEAAEIMRAAEKLGLRFEFEKTNKRLFGLDGNGKEYEHQNYGYSVTVYGEGS